MRSLHVFVAHGDWNHKVDVKMIQYVDNEAKQHNQTCVLKVGQLDIHGAELNTPTDVGGGRRWRLETHRVPIGRLQVFKMSHDLVVIDLVIHEFALVSGNRVSFK